MRKLWIGTGWKMNKTLDEARQYAARLREQIEVHQTDRDINVFIVPPFTVLSTVCGLLKDSPIRVGAQNMHWEDQGAFTGEISPVMVKDCGAQLVELGHSERREYFCETDQGVNLKVLAALRHGLQPLVCIGEPAQEREYGVAQEYVLQQLKKRWPESRPTRWARSSSPMSQYGLSAHPGFPPNRSTWKPLTCTTKLFPGQVVRTIPPFQ